jgi:hypothetical protein
MPALIAAPEALRHPKLEHQGAARLKLRPAQSPTGTEFRAVADIMNS